MDHFSYRNGCLYAEDVALTAIAEQYGTPCYIYSRATIERHWRAFDSVFKGRDHLVCYAVKANSNIAVLNLLARLGSGFDIVSGGELERVLRAGGDPAKVVFSGVGKTAQEIERALEVGILCFNVESEGELEQIDRIAVRLGKVAPVSLRVNPDVDAKTHRYISTGLKENKFGIDISDAIGVAIRAVERAGVTLVGLDCHIGSQLTDSAPFVAALERIVQLAEQLEIQGIRVRHLDIGGGLGITYRDETPPDPAAYAKAIFKKLSGEKYRIIIEPGRAIVGNAGVLLTRIEYLKSTPYKHFAIVDAGMNDLMRPALYDAWQSIVPVVQESGADARVYDVVGPVCETGDFLGKERELAICQGDLLAVRSAGAYGFSMSSNYNSRPRAAEVMVDGGRAYLIRERETIDGLMAGEMLLPGV
jgi:diaminopimelate decarboxylase